MTKKELDGIRKKSEMGNTYNCFQLVSKLLDEIDLLRSEISMDAANREANEFIYDQNIKILLNKVDKSLDLIFRYSGIDGSHHKQWVLDQVVRTLTGEHYDEWVSGYEDGDQYSWDEGIAP